MLRKLQGQPELSPFLDLDKGALALIGSSAPLADRNSRLITGVVHTDLYFNQEVSALRLKPAVELHSRES